MTPKEKVNEVEWATEDFLLKQFSDEIVKIANDFSHETGLQVGSISFNMVNVTTLGDKTQKQICSSVTIERERL